jgi:hypothetical protein
MPTIPPPGENKYFIEAENASEMAPPTAWPMLMDECRRITRPGGIIRLTETEWNLTNSLAYETLHAMTTRALKKAGKSFSPDGRNVGSVPPASAL